MGIDTVRVEKLRGKPSDGQAVKLARGSRIVMAQDQPANRQLVECISRAGRRYRHKHDAHHDFSVE